MKVFVLTYQGQFVSVHQGYDSATESQKKKFKELKAKQRRETLVNHYPIEKYDFLITEHDI